MTGMRPEQLRQAVARAALPLLGEYETLTTARIAQAAGIGEADLLAVFADKEAVMQACVAILAEADAFLTHAGMGGSSEGMFTGTPMIAAPQATDQFENADALVAAGVAVRVDSSEVSAAGLRDALARVDAEPVRRRSAELAAELRSAGGVDAAVRVVEEFL